MVPETLVKFVYVAVLAKSKDRGLVPKERLAIVFIVILDGDVRIAAKCAGP